MMQILDDYLELTLYWRESHGLYDKQVILASKPLTNFEESSNIILRFINCNIGTVDILHFQRNKLFVLPEKFERYHNNIVECLAAISTDGLGYTLHVDLLTLQQQLLRLPPIGENTMHNYLELLVTESNDGLRSITSRTYVVNPYSHEETEHTTIKLELKLPTLTVVEHFSSGKPLSNFIKSKYTSIIIEKCIAIMDSVELSANLRHDIECLMSLLCESKNNDIRSTNPIEALIGTSIVEWPDLFEDHPLFISFDGVILRLQDPHSSKTKMVTFPNNDIVKLLEAWSPKQERHYIVELIRCNIDSRHGENTEFILNYLIRMLHEDRETQAVGDIDKDLKVIYDYCEIDRDTLINIYRIGTQLKQDFGAEGWAIGNLVHMLLGFSDARQNDAQPGDDTNYRKTMGIEL